LRFFSSIRESHSLTLSRETLSDWIGIPIQSDSAFRASEKQPLVDAVKEAGIEEMKRWLTGNTLTNRCAQNGTVWTCDFTGRNGYAAQAVWDTSKTCKRERAGQASILRILSTRVTGRWTARSARSLTTRFPSERNQSGSKTRPKELGLYNPASAVCTSRWQLVSS